jgi:hypothetical protein
VAARLFLESCGQHSHTSDFDAPDSELRGIATALARKLDAIIKGDDGEAYP